MKNAKIWFIVIGFVVGACLLGWLISANAVRNSRADILARARSAKARKAKAAAAGGSSTETESESSNN